MFQVAILVFMFSEIRGRTSPAISADWLHSVALSNPDLKMPATRGLSLRPKGDPCEKLFQNWRALIGRQFQTETGHQEVAQHPATKNLVYIYEFPGWDI